MSIGFIMGFDFLFCSSFMKSIKKDFSLPKKIDIPWFYFKCTQNGTY